MNSDLYQIKRARFNLDFVNSLSFDKEMDTSCINYNPANKPLPSDLAEFLADPYRFRVSEEFLNTVVLEVRQLNMLCTHRNSLPPSPYTVYQFVYVCRKAKLCLFIALSCKTRPQLMCSYDATLIRINTIVGE